VGSDTLDALDPALPRQIILTLVRQLRDNIVPLTSRALAPTHFVVYLHPEDHLQLAGIGPLIVEEASREMNAEISRLSRWSGRWWRLLYRVLNPWADAPPLPIDGAVAQRHIELLPDPDGDLPRGRFTVRTQLPAAAGLDFAGTATVSVTSGLATEGATRGAVPATPPRQAYGRLTFRDEEGTKTFEICEDKTLVGRGGQGVWVDVRVRGPVEISQEHMRIRRDPATGEFFIKDLSRNGTTVDGRRLPPGAAYDADAKREVAPHDHEQVLPPRALISLADQVVINFERTSQ
jgi:hypothetical protein